MLTTGNPASGRPQVVLLPGLGSVGYLFEVLHGCGGWTRATLLDLPGFGRRETADLPADLDSLSAAVTSLVVEALPEPPVVLVGHSTGAQIALRAALQAPQRIRALALIGPTFEPQARQRSRLLTRLLHTSIYEPPGQLRYTLPDYVRGGRRFRQYLRSGLQDRPEEQIATVPAPVLIGRGRHDHFSSPQWVQWLADAAARGRARTLPGAHNMPYAYPGAVVGLIGEACASTSVA